MRTRNSTNVHIVFFSTVFHSVFFKTCFVKTAACRTKGIWSDNDLSANVWELRAFCFSESTWSIRGNLPFWINRVPHSLRLVHIFDPKDLNIEPQTEAIRSDPEQNLNKNSEKHHNIYICQHRRMVHNEAIYSYINYKWSSAEAPCHEAPMPASRGSTKPSRTRVERRMRKDPPFRCERILDGPGLMYGTRFEKM